MTGVDRYLNEVCWAMGGSLAEQQAARDELRAHIAGQVRDFQRGGMSPDDALVRTLADLGDASAVGAAMRGSRGSGALRRPLVQPVGALVIGWRPTTHLPRPALLAALAAAAAFAAVVPLLYLWPG